MKPDEYGEMKIGMMCLNCGYLTPANDMMWSHIWEYREDDVPIIHLICPMCGHIKSNEVVTYMIVDREVEQK